MSRKENALDLAKFVDKGVRVKLSGGREGSCLTASSPPLSGTYRAACLADLCNARCAPACMPLSSMTRSGQRAVEGVLKGYDQLLNLVMDETVEYLRGDGNCCVPAYVPVLHSALRRHCREQKPVHAAYVQLALHSEVL